MEAPGYFGTSSEFKLQKIDSLIGSLGIHLCILIVRFHINDQRIEKTARLSQISYLLIASITAKERANVYFKLLVIESQGLIRILISDGRGSRHPFKRDKVYSQWIFGVVLRVAIWFSNNLLKMPLIHCNSTGMFSGKGEIQVELCLIFWLCRYLY